MGGLAHKTHGEPARWETERHQDPPCRTMWEPVLHLDVCAREFTAAPEHSCMKAEVLTAGVITHLRVSLPRHQPLQYQRPLPGASLCAPVTDRQRGPDASKLRVVWALDACLVSGGDPKNTDYTVPPSS